MSFYGNRQVAHYGYFGAAFGGGLEVFVGGPSFQGSSSYKAFFDDGTSAWAQGVKAYGLSWSRPSDAVLRAASQVWMTLDNGSTADAAYKEAMGRKLAGVVASIDALGGAHDVWGTYSQAVTAQLIARMTELKNLLKQLGTYKSATAGVNLVTSYTASQDRDAATGDGHPPEDEEYSPVLLYAGLGVGALALVGGLYFLFRPSGSRTAGYRRRRRR